MKNRQLNTLRPTRPFPQFSLRFIFVLVFFICAALAIATQAGTLGFVSVAFAIGFCCLSIGLNGRRPVMVFVALVLFTLVAAYAAFCFYHWWQWHQIGIDFVA